MSYKILLADDEKLTLMITANALMLADESYDIIKAYDGQEALDIALNNDLDLLLLDWEMPKMSGFEVLKQLKANPKTRAIPVIMATGQTTSDKLQLALEAGAMDYIRKPIDKIELFARVKSALHLYDSIRKIERQKQELERLSVIAQQTDNSVILLNYNGEIEWVNEGFKRLYEYTLEEFNQQYNGKIFASSDEINWARELNAIRENKHSATFESVAETKSGEFKWVQTKVTPLFNGDGKVKNFIAIEADITRLKEAERNLKKQNEGLEHLTNSLREVNEEQERKNQEIKEQKELIEREKRAIEKQKLLVERERTKAEKLLSNILPDEVAKQLKNKGSVRPRNYRKATVLFTDFKGFTQSCEALSPSDLVQALHTFFITFDDIIGRHYIEKIKTIGDAYMCVGGLPIRNRSNPFDVVLAGLEIQNFMNTIAEKRRYSKLPRWQLRLGIHTGPVVAGVVGKIKFAYDIWGDTVNIAARMEQSGQVGKVNISGSTYELIKDYFDCSYRGKIEAKNKGKIDMYFVDGLKAEYSVDGRGINPNQHFLEVLNSL